MPALYNIEYWSQVEIFLSDTIYYIQTGNIAPPLPN